MSTPRLGAVQCLSKAGLHMMRYRDWGDPRNPRVLVCVHGLTRLGADFDRLAQALCAEYRVVCPDVVGRGLSDWLPDPALYAIPQYVADLLTLLARLDVPAVDWLGTSMGGLIGIALAGRPGSPIQRLVLNDVGPQLEFVALQRIAAYVGVRPHFANLDEATSYVRSIAPGFGLRTAADWRELTVAGLKPDGAGWTLHYDPAIGLALNALTPEILAASEQHLWELYDAIACPTLLVRGELSDLLSPAAARRMGERGPRPTCITLPQVGHAPMFFYDDQVELVREFLRATRPN